MLDRRITLKRNTLSRIRTILRDIIAASKVEVKKPYSESIIASLSATDETHALIDGATFNMDLFADDPINRLLDIIRVNSLVQYGDAADVASAYETTCRLIENDIIDPVFAVQSLGARVPDIRQALSSRRAWTTTFTSTFVSSPCQDREGAEVNTLAGVVRLPSTKTEYAVSGFVDVSLYALSEGVRRVYTSSEDRIFAKDMLRPFYSNFTSYISPSNSHLPGSLGSLTGLVTCMRLTFSEAVRISRVSFVPFGHGPTTVVAIRSSVTFTEEWDSATPVSFYRTACDLGIEVNLSEQVMSRVLFVIMNQETYTRVQSDETIPGCEKAEALTDLYGKRTALASLAAQRNPVTRTQVRSALASLTPDVVADMTDDVVPRNALSYVSGFTRLSVSLCSYSPSGEYRDRALRTDGRVISFSMEAEGNLSVPSGTSFSSHPAYQAATILHADIDGSRYFVPGPPVTIGGNRHMVDGSAIEVNYVTSGGTTLVDATHPLRAKLHFIPMVGTAIGISSDGAVRTFTPASGDSSVNLEVSGVTATLLFPSSYLSMYYPGSTIIVVYRPATTVGDLEYTPWSFPVEGIVGRPTISAGSVSLPASSSIYTRRPFLQGETSKYRGGVSYARGAYVTDSSSRVYRCVVAHTGFSSISTAVAGGYLAEVGSFVTTEYDQTEYSLVTENGTRKAAVGRAKGEEGLAPTRSYVVISGTKYRDMCHTVTDTSATVLRIDGDSRSTQEIENGSGIIFRWTDTSHSPGITRGTTYYITGLTRYSSYVTFSIAATPGGTAISVTEAVFASEPAEIVGPCGAVVGDDGRLYRPWSSDLGDIRFHIGDGTDGELGEMYREYDSRIDPPVGSPDTRIEVDGIYYVVWTDAYEDGTVVNGKGDYCAGTDMLVTGNRVYRRFSTTNPLDRNRIQVTINGSVWTEYVFSSHENVMLKNGVKYVLWTERAASSYYIDMSYADGVTGIIRPRVYRQLSTGVDGFTRVADQTYVSVPAVLGPYPRRFWHGVFGEPAKYTGSTIAVGEATCHIYTTGTDYVKGTLVVYRNGVQVEPAAVATLDDYGATPTLYKSEFALSGATPSTDTVLAYYIPIWGTAKTGYEGSILAGPNTTETKLVTSAETVSTESLPFVDRLITTSQDFVESGGSFILAGCPSVVYEPVIITLNGAKLRDITPYNGGTAVFPDDSVSPGTVYFAVNGTTIRFSRKVSGTLVVRYYRGNQTVVPGLTMYRSDDREMSVTPEIASLSVFANVRK